MLCFLTSCKEENEFVNNKNVKYYLGGTSGSYSITYASKGGGTQQESNVANSWKYEFTAHPGDFLYISAQNNHNSGSVEVYISIDGKLFKSAVSTGAYVIATVSGSCP
jgi:hypothetical protein